MIPKVGLSMVSAGTALSFFGMLQMLLSFGDLSSILVWSTAAVAGVFVLTAGIYRTIMDADTGERGNPDGIGLTGPRYGLR